MENNNKKYYTFLNIQKCEGKNGGTYNGVTAILNLTNIETKMTGDGKKVVTSRAAINNRTNLLNTALGCNLVDKDGAIWVSVDFWEDRAERFQKFICNNTKARLVIVGSIAARKFAKNDGTEGESVTIRVNDWQSLGGTSEGATAAPATSTPQNNIPVVEDDDLPF